MHLSCSITVGLQSSSGKPLLTIGHTVAIAISLSVVLLVAVGVIFMWCICVRVRHSHQTAKLPTGPLPDRRSVTSICHI
jgi:hypothetical protein